ncbi:class 1 internalin InlG [Listeria monocytogenes]|nr:class 1 internalin InlG [Listeria monocytogenes]
MKQRKTSVLHVLLVVTAILGISLWVNASHGMKAQAESIAQPAPINEIFTDPALADEVKTELGKADVSDVVSQADLDQITRLEAEGKGINSIEGVQYLTNLNFLSVTSNQISDISPLTNLTKLESLCLGENQISDLTPLSGLTNLTFVQLSINQIKDVTPLANLTKLNYLDLRENQISDASPLVNMTDLTVLHLEKQQITAAPVVYQTNLVAPDILKNAYGEVVPPTTISNNGTFASPNITWNLDSFTSEVSYDFNQKITLGDNGKVTFAGTVVQPIVEAPVNYITTFDVDGTTTTENVVVDTLITEPAEPTKEGYTFSGWYDAETGGNEWDFAVDKMPATNMTLYAQFTINSYTATFDVDGETTNQKVDYQALLQEPTAPTKDGYTFVGWYDAKTGGTEWDFATSKMPTSDITLYARFTKNPSSDNSQTAPGKDDKNDKDKLTIKANDSADATSTKLPKTSDDSSMIPTILGTLFIGGAILILRKKTTNI